MCIGTDAGVLSIMFGSWTFANLHFALRPSMDTDAALSTYAVSASTSGGLAQPGDFSSQCFIELTTAIASPAGAPRHSSTVAAATALFFLLRNALLLALAFTISSLIFSFPGSSGQSAGMCLTMLLHVLQNC